MTSTEYLSGHDFYALKRRTSKPGSDKAYGPTGVLHMDAWMLEGLETVDANVRALGLMMAPDDKLDSNVAAMELITDGQGRIKPGFRKHGIPGMKLKAAVTVDARTKEYAAKLSSASDLREPSLDMKSSTGSFDKKFLCHLETIDHNLHQWFLAAAPDTASNAGLVRVPARAASLPRVLYWETWHLNAIEIINANIINFALAFRPNVDVAPPRAGTGGCCVVS